MDLYIYIYLSSIYLSVYIKYFFYYFGGTGGLNWEPPACYTDPLALKHLL
jgi:hypothetical protein